uniref:Major facilitator superfamily (MFS) profile domain-containing protein n=2 Tax=Hemiselmis andersenii TaxID=464988 RepID=A0A7S1H4C3_HEMAN
MVIGCCLIVFGAVPCMGAMGEGSIAAAVLGQGSLMCIISVLAGNVPTWMVRAFPVHIRFTTIAVGYNAGQAAFGGTASILATLIYSQTGSTMLIGLYHACLAGVAMCCVVWSERRRRSEDDPLKWMVDKVRDVSSNGGGDRSEA